MSISFEQLVEEYHPMIYKICRVYSHAYDFDDLYQEALINIWKAYKGFRGEAKVSTWLYRVVLNTGLTYQRNEKKHQNKVSEEYLPELVAGASEAEQKAHQVEQLNYAIKQLSKADRAVIVLVLEGQSYKEIAAITGHSLSNVGVKINRIKKRLYQLLKSTQDAR